MLPASSVVNRSVNETFISDSPLPFLACQGDADYRADARPRKGEPARVNAMDGPSAPLSPRLQALYDAIPPGSRVADIGSGHGLLPLALAASGRAAHCLATEKTEGLLLRVARPAAGSSGASRLAFRAGDGLDAILTADRIDTIVLAGIGSR